MTADRVKVALRHRSKGFKPGDVVEVTAEEAEYLIRNGTVDRVPAEPEKKAKKSDKD